MTSLGSRNASPRIYLSPPDMSDRERASLMAAFDSNWIAPLGPEVDAFKKDWQFGRACRGSGAQQRHGRPAPGDGLARCGPG